MTYDDYDQWVSIRVYRRNKLPKKQNQIFEQNNVSALMTKELVMILLDKVIS